MFLKCGYWYIKVGNLTVKCGFFWKNYSVLKILMLLSLNNRPNNQVNWTFFGQSFCVELNFSDLPN